MFGENYILGRAELVTDSKGRLYIPEFTGAEEGDEVVLMITCNGPYLCSKLSVYKEIENLKQKIENSIDYDDYIRYSKDLERFQSHALGIYRIDGKNRICDAKILGKKINYIVSGYDCGLLLKRR